MRSASSVVLDPLRRRTRVRNERGIALVVAIVALVVIGAIVAGTFFVSSLEQKTAGNAVYAAQAYQAAEAGIVNAVAHWNPAYNALPVDSSVAAPRDSVGRGTYANVTISRLNANLFLVRSVGSKRGASQTLATVLRMVTVDPAVSAALTTTADVSLSGPVGVDGADLPPGGWSACSPGAGMGGIRAGGVVHAGGHAAVTGASATLQHDSSITAAVLQAPFEKLQAAAALSLEGGSGPGAFTMFSGVTPRAEGSPAVCNRTDPNNWGEPLRGGSHVAPCTGYAPVVYIDGNARIAGPGRGQGVLLVRGDLSIAGGFTWVGLVIATGELSITDGSGAITGAALAHGASLVNSGTGGGAPAVSYSTCALDYALRSAAVARPLTTRAWLQDF